MAPPKATHATPSDERHSMSVVKLVHQDHDRVRALWAQYKLPGLGTTAQQKQLLAWEIIREVSMHAAKEVRGRDGRLMSAQGGVVG